MDKIEYSQGLALKLQDGSIISAKGDSPEEVEDRLIGMTGLHDRLTGKTPLKSNPTAPQGYSYKGTPIQSTSSTPEDSLEEHTCEVPEHNNAKLIQGTSKTKFYDNGNPKKYWYHMVGKTMCFGKE